MKDLNGYVLIQEIEETIEAYKTHTKQLESAVEVLHHLGLIEIPDGEDEVVMSDRFLFRDYIKDFRV